MKRSIGKSLVASVIALALTTFAMASIADAARGARGGDRGGARAGGGGAVRAGGQARGQQVRVNNSRADVRTNRVRSGSVNNVNVNRNVNVNVDNRGCCGGWDDDYHPVARAAAVTGAVAVTSAVVGSMVRSVPPSCVPVNYGGMVYQQCGSTWYLPQGGQYVVVNPPY